VPVTVTVVPPADVPEVGDIDETVGAPDANVTEDSPEEIMSALSMKAIADERLKMPTVGEMRLPMMEKSPKGS
jgi:hypothetical protein